MHSDDKAGKDAGELAGVGPTGVIATQDLDAAIALDADAFCYMATTHGRLKVAIGELCQILESGKNVATTSFGLLIHPGSARPDILARLEESAQRGDATLLSTGIEPGFFSDYLPVILSGCSQRIDSIRTYEFAVYESGHQSDQVAFEICGFGQPIDTQPPIVDPAGMSQWAGVVASIAEQLGVTLDGIETAYELWPAEDSFEYQGRRIEAGTIAGFRFEIAGVVGGQKKVAVEHITRTHEDQAPGWPRGLAGDAYRVVIDGSPRLDCEFNFREGDDHLAGWLQHHRDARRQRHPAALPSGTRRRVHLRSAAGHRSRSGRALARAVRRQPLGLGECVSELVECVADGEDRGPAAFVGDPGGRGGGEDCNRHACEQAWPRVGDGIDSVAGADRVGEGRFPCRNDDLVLVPVGVFGGSRDLYSAEIECAVELCSFRERENAFFERADEGLVGGAFEDPVIEEIEILAPVTEQDRFF